MDFRATVKGSISIPWHYFWSLLSLALPILAEAGEENPAQTAVFAVQTVDGSLVKGSWRGLGSDWSLRLGQGEGRRVTGGNILNIRRLNAPLPPLPMDHHLILANGDRLPCRELRLVEEKFHFRHVNLEGGKDVSLPLAAVAVLWYTAPDKTLDAEKLRRRISSGSRTRDTVCLRNGDVVDGVLTSLDANNAVIAVDKRRVTVKTPQLAYVAFNTELADMLRPKGTYARLILRDNRPGLGGRISLTSASADENTLRGTTVFGAHLQAPLHDIVALDPQQANSVYISDLKGSQYSFQPFLDAAWPFAVDGNVAGHDLLLADSTYDKGIGMHSHGRLSYRLPDAFRRFEALVGLDDKDGQGGAVRIRVLADGAALMDRDITSQDGAVPVSLNIKGARQVTLEVDFGRGGDVRDVVNWVDARLVK